MAKNNFIDVEPMISELEDGVVAFTQPWALASIRYSAVGINRHYTVTVESGGASSLKIKREGYVILVDRTTLGEREITASWEREDCMGARLVDHIRMVADLKMGEIAYTVYWALSSFPRLGIYKNFAISSKPQGDRRMKIKRVSGSILVQKDTINPDYIPVGGWPKELCRYVRRISQIE